MLAVIALSMACAPKTPPQHPKPKPETREPPVTLGEPEDLDTPERAASEALVEEGKVFLEKGMFDSAGDKFQEAISIDPSYGVPYYYMAHVKLKGGEYGGVWGFLEKAEELLAKNPEWTAKLKILREELEHDQPR